MYNAFEIQLVFVKDKQKFYDKQVKRYISTKSAIEKLINTGKFTLVDAEQVIENLKDFGVDSATIRQRRNLPISDLYNEAQALLPYRYYITPQLDTITFQIKPNGEAINIQGDDDDKLLKGILKYEDYYEKLYSVYESSNVLEALDTRPEFEEYMKILFKKYRTDKDKQLEKEPSLLSWDTNELAFRQMCPAELREGPTPTWDQFLTRLDYPEVFMAWVWTVFDPDNHTRQVMWLRGEGNDGKSSVMNALSEIYGKDAAAAIGPGSESQNWFFSNLYGKRFVVYADCSNPNLISHSRIKSATTGDRVPIEFKNENAFHGYIYSKFLISSNVMPRIDLFQDAQVSRLIKLEVSKVKGGNRDYGFQKRLVDEGYAFLYKCHKYYEKYVDEQRKTEIILPEELIEKIEADCASQDFNILSEFIDATLEFGENYYYKQSEFRKDLGMFLAEYNVSARKLPYFLEGFLVRKNKLKFSEDRKMLTDSHYKVNIFKGFRKKGSKAVLEKEQSE